MTVRRNRQALKLIRRVHSWARLFFCFVYLLNPVNMQTRFLNIAIILTSRGVLSTRMKESVERELQALSIPHRFYYAHGEKIPDCFNRPTGEALKGPCNYIWYVEEDIVVPEGGLSAMLEMSRAEKNGVVAINYPLRQYRTRSEGWFRQGTHYKFRSWVGLGCTLVRRDVFTTMIEKGISPFFKPANLVAVHRGSASKRRELMIVEGRRRYGGQDIYFCYFVRKIGYEICVVDNLLAGHQILPLDGAYVPLCDERGQAFTIPFVKLQEGSNAL